MQLAIGRMFLGYRPRAVENRTMDYGNSGSSSGASAVSLRSSTGWRLAESVRSAIRSGKKQERAPSRQATPLNLVQPGPRPWGLRRACLCGDSQMTNAHMYTPGKVFSQTHTLPQASSSEDVTGTAVFQAPPHFWRSPCFRHFLRGYVEIGCGALRCREHYSRLPTQSP
eukprot:354548-Chlamydomonas_euryale.AAC.16